MVVRQPAVEDLVSAPRCRHCAALLAESFCDLGMSPFANSYVAPDRTGGMEPFFPLHARVCTGCWLVQLPEFRSGEQIFSDYAYFSSYSDGWVEHARRYAVAMADRLGLGADSQVIEIASNDGYLLQHFKAMGVPVLGIEPAANVAGHAREKGIDTVVEFFGPALAARLSNEGRQADLLLGNNVLAHVPDLNGFVAALKPVLKPGGVITMEFPHLLQLMRQGQFDTIYHEHFCYFSLLTVERVFAAAGLRLFDVEELPTHGGSLRIFAAHAEAARPEGPGLARLRAEEAAAGLDGVAAYRDFAERVRRIKRALLRFLIDAREAGKSVAAYGAPAKASTLLNYCGAGPDLIDYTVDRSPEKQGRLLPGVRIPIHAPDRILETRPDYLLILPWNLKDEVMEQMAAIRGWGGRFVLPIPELEVL